MLVKKITYAEFFWEHFTMCFDFQRILNTENMDFDVWERPFISVTHSLNLEIKQVVDILNHGAPFFTNMV